MAAEASRSSTSADSYIGSLISLTSKSEIRYEGVLYNINTEESSIGLRNVRSFGTEGRKKDGPQIPPSDKVYEYILFRGTDIKDLQVKSSPPVQPVPSINNDPAIIQSHYPRPVASSSTTVPSAVSGSVTDLSGSLLSQSGHRPVTDVSGSHSAQSGHPVSAFPGGLPLYQPGGNLTPWAGPPPPPPPPSASGSGIGMPPIYWQGFYGPPPNGLPPSGLPPHLHQQQTLLRPPPGLSMPPPMHYPGFNPTLQSGSSNLPELPSSLLPTTATGSLNLTSNSVPNFNLPSSLPSNMPLVPSASLASETTPSLIPNKASTSDSLPALPPLTTSGPTINVIAPPLANKSNPVPGPTFSYQTPSQPMATIVGSSSSSNIETPLPPSLVTPGQLLQSGTTMVSVSQSSQTAHKDVEVVQVLSTLPEQSVPVSAEAQPPILPTPVPSRGGVQRLNGAPFHSRHGYRGRERGRGSGVSRPVARFTEDFDFTAMNEKFNKDEVWGHLGKSNKKDKEEGNISDEYSQDEDDELPKFEMKPTYNKDDFFDTLSCNALDHESQNGRPKFSEQMKIDTETFGDFPRHRGGRGGRGPGRGFRGRGNYYGRGGGFGYGYGYASRGRGRGRGPPVMDHGL